MYEMILFCKENMKCIKTFGKDIQQAVNTFSLDGEMVGHLNFFFYCLGKCFFP